MTLSASSTVQVLNEGGGVYTLLLSNPARMNMMSDSQINDMEVAIRILKSLDVRCVVFRGEGKHFCAGLDPFMFEQTMARCKTVPEFAAMSHRFFSVYSALREVRAPILAVLHGTVIGGGVAMAMTSDWRIASKNVHISAGILPRGLSFGFMLTQSLHRVLGMGKAFGLWLEQKEYVGEHALEYGLVNAVEDDLDTAIQRAMTLARSIASSPSAGRNGNLMNMRDPVNPEVLSRESTAFALAIQDISIHNPNFLRSRKAQTDASSQNFDDLPIPTPQSKIKSSKMMERDSKKDEERARKETEEKQAQLKMKMKMERQKEKEQEKEKEKQKEQKEKKEKKEKAKPKEDDGLNIRDGEPHALIPFGERPATATIPKTFADRVIPVFEKAQEATKRGEMPYYNVITGIDTFAVMEDGKRMMCLTSSGDYHGMHADERVHKVTEDAIKKYSAGSLGPSLMAGHTVASKQLEEDLSNLLGTEDCMLFSMGYATNCTYIPALVHNTDTIYISSNASVSLVEGSKLSGAKMCTFDPEDLKTLEDILQKNAKLAGSRFIIADSVFASSGRLLNLPEIHKIAVKNDCLLAIDESHSVGVVGMNGRGIEEYYNMMGSIHLKSGSVGKALGAVGGFIAGPRSLVTFLRFHTRGYVYSASIPPVQSATADAALRILRIEAWRIAKCKENASHWANLLKEYGFDVIPRNEHSGIVCAKLGNDENVLPAFSILAKKVGYFAPFDHVEGEKPILKTIISGAFNKQDIEDAAIAFAAIAYHLGVVSVKPKKLFEEIASAYAASSAASVASVAKSAPKQLREDQIASIGKETLVTEMPFTSFPVPASPSIPNSILAPIAGFSSQIDELKQKNMLAYLNPTVGFDTWAKLTDGRRVMTMTSNGDYHGMHGDQRVVQKAVEVSRKYSAGTLGSSFTCGYTDEARKAEKAIAELFGVEDCLLTAMGFSSNLTGIPALMQPGDLIFCDAANHACILDGSKVSGANIIIFRTGDMKHLAQRLETYKDHKGAKMLISDAIFSATGELCDLPELHRLAKKYDCLLVLDEAHSIGLVGVNGRGVCEHFGMMGAANLHTGSIGKAFGSLGGFCAGPKEIISYLRFKCNGFINTAAIPAIQAAAALEAIHVLRTERWRLQRTKDNAALWAKLLAERGFEIRPRHTESGIVSAWIGQKQEESLPFGSEIIKLGFFAPVMLGEGRPFLRCVISGAFKKDDLVDAADAFATVAFKLGVLPRPKRLYQPKVKVEQVDAEKVKSSEASASSESSDALHSSHIVKDGKPASTDPALPLKPSSLSFVQNNVLESTGMASNVGIIAIEVYTPDQCVVTSDIEVVEGLPKGHRTSFSGDAEDAVSCSMNAVLRLMERHGINPADIGRLEVGTESPVDHSKSIKTFLMPLFHKAKNHNIEGVELRSGACSSTVALIDTLAWVQSPSWDGRYGIVVAVDDWEASIPRCGCVCAAILIGPGAPVVIDSVYGAYASDDVGFALRPLGWMQSEPPTPNMELSKEHYIKAMKSVYDHFTLRATQSGRKDLLNPISTHDYVSISGVDASPMLQQEAFSSLCQKEGVSNDQAASLFDAKATPCRLLDAHIGYSGNASLALGLLSATMNATAPGKKLLSIVFGRGSTALMLSMRIDGATADGAIAITESLLKRKVLSGDQFRAVHAAKISHHRCFDWKPKVKVTTPGTYVMDHVLGNGSRFYEMVKGEWSGKSSSKLATGAPTSFAAHKVSITADQHPMRKDAGLLGVQAFCPTHMVSMLALEEMDKCPGKYTKGLEMKDNGFCGDNEDAASAAINAVSKLLQRLGVSWEQIGRIDVGTETPSDAVKPIASYVAGKLGPSTNMPVICCDHTNACYAGTSAVLSAASWLESPLYDGRYAVVVVCDVSYAGVRYWSGYGGVAMLFGRDAKVVLEMRCSYMDHFWDFWKPEGWATLFPIVDGPLSMQNYIHSMTKCQETFRSRLGSGLLEAFDYWVFHTTTPNFLKKVSTSYYANEVAAGAKTSPEREQFFASRVDMTTLMLKEVGLLYSVAVWANFSSLLATADPEKIVGKRICLFSFGSGATSSMLCWRCKELPPDMKHMQQLFADRVHSPAKEYIRVRQTYCDLLGKFDFHPQQGEQGIRDGWVYLSNIDKQGTRVYTRKEKKKEE